MTKLLGVLGAELLGVLELLVFSAIGRDILGGTAGTFGSRIANGVDDGTQTYYARNTVNVY